MKTQSAFSRQRSAGPVPVNHYCRPEPAGGTGGTRPRDGLVLARKGPTRPEDVFHLGTLNSCSEAFSRISPVAVRNLAFVHRRRAFTLLELVAVIAVIGILAALLFPGVRAARTSAYKAKTRVQFNQWAAALEGFRTEYGYYPVLHGSNLVNPPGQTTDPTTLHLFHDLLAARRRDGSALPAFTAATGSQFPEAQNRKLVSFLAFTASDFTATGLLGDAFGDAEIAVLVDRDLDGVIRIGSDFTDLPAVTGLTPGAVDFPAGGVRAGVVFYAAAPGASPANPEFIFSWK